MDNENIEVEATENVEAETEQPEATEEPDMFPRAYVEQLRKENADARGKLKGYDDLAARLHMAQVKATGRLADPTDLPYSEELLDPETLNAAIDDLLAAKPHLASRVPRGDIGQGATGSGDSFSLANFIRQGV